MRTPLHWTDGHLDLANLAESGRDMSKPVEECGAGHPPNCAVTLASLREGHVTRAVATIFVHPRVPTARTSTQPPADPPWYYSSEAEAHEAALRQLAIYQEWAQRGWIRLLGGIETSEAGSATATPGEPPLEVVLMIEGAAGVRTEDDLRFFHAQGVRMLSLTWANGTKYAGGNESGSDLTPEGRKFVRTMDELGIIHDVSHLSERAFWSLLAESKGPKVATHSNCRALLPGRRNDQRNLTDDQIRAIGQTGGLVGVNLYSPFLRTDRRATVADVVRHAAHIADLMGRRDAVALGSDMDGGIGADMLPSDLDHPRHLHRLAEALANAGWNDDDIHGFACANWNRFLARTLGI